MFRHGSSLVRLATWITQPGLPQPQRASPTTEVALWVTGNPFQLPGNVLPVTGNAFSLAGHAN
jgi:hypothetical protein